MHTFMSLHHGCSLSLDVLVLLSKRLVSVSWKGLGLDLASDWKSNVSVSYHRVLFTSQHAQPFASLQNCTYMVLNARHLYCLLIHKFTYLLQCRCMRLIDRDVIPESIEHGEDAIHCFGTMLKVEGLEKRLSLGLARSRSRLAAKIRSLGLVSVSRNCRKVLVLVSDQKLNVSSRSRKLRSRLHPCSSVTTGHIYVRSTATWPNNAYNQ